MGLDFDSMWKFFLIDEDTADVGNISDNIWVKLQSHTATFSLFFALFLPDSKADMDGERGADWLRQALGLMQGRCGYVEGTHFD
jgi:hypothetical protein